MTSEPSEIEFKFRVDDEEALAAVARAALGDDAGLPAPARQVNHFFDSADRRLAGAGCALRLREEEGRAWLTAKGRAAGGGDATLTRREETEVELDAELGRALLAGERDPLAVLRERAGTGLVARMQSALGGAAVAYLGAFENQRRRVGPFEREVGGEPVVLLLELDRTRFPGDRVECEVEAEVARGDEERAARALRDLLASAGVRWGSAPSKAERFFAALSASSGDGGAAEGA